MKRHPFATPLTGEVFDVYAEGKAGRPVKHGALVPALGLYQSGGAQGRVLKRLFAAGQSGSGWYVGFDPAIFPILVDYRACCIEVVLRGEQPGELDLYTTDVNTAITCGRRHNFGQGYNDRWLVPVECFDVRNENGTLVQGRSLRAEEEQGNDVELREDLDDA